MTKVGILDDEVVICETLSKYLKELGYEVPDYALSYEEAIALIDDERPDIMLLDINIGGAQSGIDVAAYIRKQHDIPIIFISSYSDKKTITDTRQVSPNGYLVKPFNKNDLFAAIETALSNFTSQLNKTGDELKLLDDAFFIKQDALYVKVRFADIRFVKSDGVYAEIYTDKKKYLIRETMKNLSEVLPLELFFQTHRSYIVNTGCIDAVTSEYVMIGDEHIPISRTTRDDFMKKLRLL